LRAVAIRATFQSDALSLHTLPTAAFIAGAAGARARTVAIAACLAVLLACRNTRAAIADLADVAVRGGCAFRRWWSVANASNAVVRAAGAITSAARP